MEPSSAQRPAAHSRRPRVTGGDLLMLAGVVFGFPVLLLVIGIPIVIVVQLVLWIGRLL